MLSFSKLKKILGISSLELSIANAEDIVDIILGKGFVRHAVSRSARCAH